MAQKEQSLERYNPRRRSRHADRESAAGDLLELTNLAAGVPVEEPSEQS